MIGAEWRKAGRTYDALREKLKNGDLVTEEMLSAALFQAWDHLPIDFRQKIEKRIFDKQYGSVREAVDRDLEMKAKQYEARITEYKDAERSYKKQADEAALERMKLNNAQNAVKIGEAFRAFCNAVGIGTNARWYDV